MSFLVCKANDLVLDRRAVARPAALNSPAVHRRAIERAADDLMRARVGVRDVAGNLGLADALGGVRERDRRLVAGLDLEALEVDRARVEARTGAGLQPTDAKSQCRELIAQAD